MNLKWVLLLMALSFLLVRCATIKEQKKLTFGVCYSKVTPEQVQPFDLVILEPDHYSHKEVEALKQTNTEVIGYISLGEVNPYRWYHPILEMRGFLGRNENWNSDYINLADSTARDILTDHVAPEIMIKGFEGFFLDTIDAVAPYTERDTLSDEMAGVIEGLRKRFPEARIIQNAGLFLLDRTSSMIDGVALEDVATHYFFDKQQYHIRADSIYRQRLDLVHSYARKYEKPFYIIDFAEKPENRKEVFTMLDTVKYPYYIGNISLDSLYAPGAR